MIPFIKRHLLVGVIIIAVIIGIFLTRDKFVEEEIEKGGNVQQVETIELTSNGEDDTLPEPPGKVIVDVKGEVMKPGVYEVDGGLRVHDVITLAGGFTAEADEKIINLAQKIEDEMVIYIAKEGEEPGHVSVISAGGGGESETGVRVNLATAEEMTQLNGIGPSKAQAIVNYREEHGPFQRLEDLLHVNGIGEKTLENMKDDIILP